MHDFPYLFQYYLHRAPWWRWVGDILLEWSWLGWDTLLQSDPRACTVLQSECRHLTYDSQEIVYRIPQFDTRLQRIGSDYNPFLREDYELWLKKRGDVQWIRLLDLKNGDGST